MAMTSAKGSSTSFPSTSPSSTPSRPSAFETWRVYWRSWIPTSSARTFTYICWSQIRGTRCSIRNEFGFWFVIQVEEHVIAKVKVGTRQGQMRLWTANQRPAGLHLPLPHRPLPFPPLHLRPRLHPPPHLLHP